MVSEKVSQWIGSIFFLWRWQNFLKDSNELKESLHYVDKNNYVSIQM